MEQRSEQITFNNDLNNYNKINDTYWFACFDSNTLMYERKLCVML